MQCFQHPQEAAVTLCTRCDQLLCGACVQDRNGKNFCGKCAQFVDRRTAQRTTGSIPVQRPAAVAPPAAAPPAVAPPVAAAPPPPPPPRAPTPRAVAPVAPVAQPTGAQPVAARPVVAQPPATRPAPLTPTPSEELYFGTSPEVAQPAPQAVAAQLGAPQPVVPQPASQPMVPQPTAPQPAAPPMAAAATDDLFFGTPATSTPQASVASSETSWDDDLLALKEDFAVPAQVPSPDTPSPAVAPSIPTVPQPAASPSVAAQAPAPYLGPPVSQLKSGAAEPSWMQNDGIIPIKEDDPPPPPASGGGMFQGSDDLFLGDPPAAPAGTTSGGDVYQGDASQGDVYQGDVYQGEAPAGDVYQGDVYQGESAQTGAMAAATVGEVAGVPLRGLIVAIFVGTVAASVWYWLSVTTGWQLGLVSWLIGVGVGIAAVAGTGRNGMDAAIIAASITGLALLMGEFQIAKYFDRQYEQVYAQAETIERDGDYTDQEVATLMGMTEDDFESLSNNEKQMMRVIAQLGDEEYDDDYYGDGESSYEEESYDTGWEPLTFGHFLGNFRNYLGFKGILIWLMGVGAAFRLGLGNTD